MTQLRYCLIKLFNCWFDHSLNPIPLIPLMLSHPLNSHQFQNILYPMIHFPNSRYQIQMLISQPHVFLLHHIITIYCAYQRFLTSSSWLETISSSSDQCYCKLCEFDLNSISSSSLSKICKPSLSEDELVSLSDGKQIEHVSTEFYSTSSSFLLILLSSMTLSSSSTECSISITDSFAYRFISSFCP